MRTARGEMKRIAGARLGIVVGLAMGVGGASATSNGIDRASLDGGDWSTAVRADERLDDLIERYASEAIRDDAEAPKNVDTAGRGRALRLYVQGRSALASGDATEAIGALQHASQSDPSSPRIFAELGMAQRGAGLEVSGLASIIRACELGSDEPVALAIGGVGMLDRNEPEMAARLLARAVKTARLEADEPMSMVVWSGLGQALIALGHTEAGAECVGRGYGSDPRLSRPPLLASEYARAERLEGHARRDAAAALLGAGEAEAALEQLAAALRLPHYRRPGVEPVLLRVAAALESPENAADAMLASVDAMNGAPAVTTVAIAARLVQMAAGPTRLELATKAGVLADAREQRGSASQRFHWRLFGAACREAAGVSPGLTPLLIDPSITSNDQLDAVSYLMLRITRDGSGSLATTAVAAAALRAEAAMPLAAAVVRLDPVAAQRLIESTAAGTTPLRPALLARLDRSDAAEEARPFIGRSGALDLMAATVAAEHGGWTAYEEAVESLRGRALLGGPAGDWLRLAEALIAGQGVDGAREAMAVVLDASPDVHDLMLAAAIAQSAGRPDEAARYTARASEIDPFDDTTALSQVGRLRGGTDAASQQAAFAMLAGLRDRQPASPAVALLAAEDLTRNDLPIAAERSLRSLCEDPATAPIAVQSIIALWRQRAQRDDTTSLADTEAWLAGLLDDQPGRVDAVVLLAQLCLLRNQPDAAFAALERAPWANSTAALRENLLRGPLDRPDDADTVRRAWLAGPWSIGRAIESAAARITSPDTASTAVEPLKSIPVDATLLPAQIAAIVNIVSSAAVSVETGGTETDRGAFAAITEWATGRGIALDPAAHDRMITLLIEQGVAAERIAASLDRAVAQHEQFRGAFVMRVAQLLFEADRGKEAFAIMAEYAFAKSASPDEQLVSVWLQFCGREGDATDVDRLMSTADEAGYGDKLIALAREIVLPGGGNAEPSPGDVYYAAGVIAAAMVRTAEAEALYRGALAVDPRHGWSANNLGYGLLEDHGDVAGAAPLLERAAEVLPGESSVIDSLGWLRYLQGRLGDLPAAVPTDFGALGAITLITRAIELADETETDGTLYDHLGDALAAAGRTAEAEAAWQSAVRLAGERLAELAGTDAPEGFRVNAETVRDGAQRKLDAVAAGKRPPITPTPAAPWSQAEPSATEAGEEATIEKSSTAP